MAAAPVEVHEHVVVGGNVDAGDAVLRTDVGDALRTVLEERVEGELRHLQCPSPVLHFADSLRNARLHVLVGVGGTALRGRLDKVLLVKRIQLCGIVAIEATEVRLVIFGYNLLDEPVLRLAHLAVASLPDEHDQVLEETYLLHVQLLPLNAEGVHGNGVLLGVAYILAADVLA